jgi:uncharacterized membrane protein (DUF485 family)
MSTTLPPLQSDDTTPTFFQDTVIFSSGLSFIVLTFAILLFMIRQILQRTIEQRYMSSLKKNSKANISKDVKDEMKRVLKEKDKKLQTCLDILFTIENFMVMLGMLLLITLLADAVAFNLINWGYSIGFGLFIIFLTAIHTFRIRRVERTKELKEAIDVTAPIERIESIVTEPSSISMESPTPQIEQPPETPISQDVEQPLHTDHIMTPNEEVMDTTVFPQTIAEPLASQVVESPPTPIGPTFKDAFHDHEDVIHKEESRLMKVFGHVLLPLEIYIRALQFGIIKGYRLPFFLLYFAISMLVAFLLTSVFYGSCVCTEPYEFSTTFSRYTMGPTCPSQTICTVVAMLPEDPATQMIIKFYTQDVPVNAYITYSPIAESPLSLTKTVNCSYIDLNQYITELENRFVYTCDITNLQPDTQYYFTLTVQTWAFSTNTTFLQSINSTGWYLKNVVFTGLNNTLASFKTLHNTTDDVFFVSGGDQGEHPMVTQLIKVAASFDPSFIAIGGDMNYDNGLSSCYRRVIHGLNLFANYAFSPSTGAMIPLLTAIGNHEAIFYRFGSNRAGIINYLAFYSHQIGLNVNNRTTYHAHKLGQSCSLLVLDSSVYATHQSQVPFINSTWTSPEHAKRVKMAMYHAPMFPSSRPLTTPVSVIGLDVWEPIFSSFNMTMGFENHDHTLKRTYVIKNGQILTDPNSSGVVYIGDGNMGVTGREPDLTRDFLAFASGASHFWTIRCNAVMGINATAIGPDGNMLDNIVRPPQ